MAGSAKCLVLSKCRCRRVVLQAPADLFPVARAMLLFMLDRVVGGVPSTVDLCRCYAWVAAGVVGEWPSADPLKQRAGTENAPPRKKRNRKYPASNKKEQKTIALNKKCSALKKNEQK